MNILIIYAHPSNKSFTYKALRILLKALNMSNHQVEVSDLYKMKFQSDMTEEEYEREGFAKTELPLSEDVIAEHRKIDWADCIVFLYPVWWSDCPAKMKGWFDRVYSAGYAYGYDRNGEKVIKMKHIKLGLVICTAGHPNDFLEETGIAGSMRNVMLDDRLGVRFEKKEMIILGGTLEYEKVANSHLEKIMNLGMNMDKFCDTLKK
ncbi:NAD(P)H-dependent oxidoreductase [Bacteroides reticulotermitis]|uniref:Oxidoreductase n=2 Tax=Bacteroides reticulotermitis TaxID=1133319 RepID=W4UYI3_9BACE|nr:NAD(P)H-dependent oxidoreductase [Bacteroides reticulotermitis]MBB4045983.1 NAD(P)H dehydrogenase (quinone) [Bacteroides reticulotermitis]GAE85892.1 oxidoreductase [Bacteroides reticulotermitis JCM 10512]